MLNYRRLFAATLAAAFLLTADDKTFPKITADLEIRKQIEAEIQSAGQEGEYGRVMRAYAKLLEFYPNEPLIRASLYLGMSDAAAHSGDDAKAAKYRATALALDPSADKKIEGSSGVASQKIRGGVDKWAAILQVAGQTMASVQQARSQYQMQQGQRMQEKLQLAQQQAQYNQQMTQFQRGPNGYVYPAAAVGAPGYVQPAINATQPMPGYTQPQGGMQLLGYDQQGQPMYGIPAAGVQGQPMSQVPGTVQMQQPMPIQQVVQQVGQPVPQPFVPQPQTIPAGGLQPNPYSGLVPYQAAALRGERFVPVRVAYDRSLAGAQPFERSCGALLDVSAANLTLTSGW